MSGHNCLHVRSFPNTALLEEEGETVHICPDCKSARLDGTTEWIPARYGMTDYLRSLVPGKKESLSRDVQAHTSPDNDPRWSRIQ